MYGRKLLCGSLAGLLLAVMGCRSEVVVVEQRRRPRPRVIVVDPQPPRKTVVVRPSRRPRKTVVVKPAPRKTKKVIVREKERGIHKDRP